MSAIPYVEFRRQYTYFTHASGAAELHCRLWLDDEVVKALFTCADGEPSIFIHDVSPYVDWLETKPDLGHSLGFVQLSGEPASLYVRVQEGNDIPVQYKLDFGFGPMVMNAALIDALRHTLNAGQRLGLLTQDSTDNLLATALMIGGSHAARVMMVDCGLRLSEARRNRMPARLEEMYMALIRESELQVRPAPLPTKSPATRL